MVNAKKHRRKAKENQLKRFISLIDGTAKKQLYKDKNRVDNKIKPKLNAEMNIGKHFRKEIERESKIFN